MHMSLATLPSPGALGLPNRSVPCSDRQLGADVGQIWGFEEINSERRYVRHVNFVGPEKENIQAKLIYDYGPSAKCPMCLLTDGSCAQRANLSSEAYRRDLYIDKVQGDQISNVYTNATPGMKIFTAPRSPTFPSAWPWYPLVPPLFGSLVCITYHPAADDNFKCFSRPWYMRGPI